MSQPDRNPVDDSTGADCQANQPSDVWFLAGTHGGRANRVCAIPFGRPIYFPVINQICTVASGEQVSQALHSCSGVVDSAAATLDGVPLSLAESTSGAAFAFTARPDSSTGFAPGVHQAVAWGLWVGPTSLTVGHHTLKFAATSGSFATDVTYQITVTNS